MCQALSSDFLMCMLEVEPRTTTQSALSMIMNGVSDEILDPEARMITDNLLSGPQMKGSRDRQM